MRSILLVLGLLLGSMSVWGAEEVAYTLEPTSGSNNSYTGDCDVTIGGITWNLTGNSQQIPWRLGGKSLTDVDREVYSKTAMSAAITKVELEVGAASSITVNSVKLIVASNADFSTTIDEVTKSFSANSTITFNPTTPATQWATGAYYKFVFNVSVSGTKNKFVEFTRAKFYTEASKTLSSITISGTPDKVTYEAGESFDPTGLVATGHYDDSSEENLTSSVEWAYTPAGALTQGLTSVNVTATKGTIIGDTDVDITVNAHVVTPGEYTIEFNNVLYGATAGTNLTSVPVDAIVHDITVTTGGNGTKARPETNCIRYYQNNTLTFAVPAGYVITGIEFTEPTSGASWGGTISVDEGTYTDASKSWAGSANSVTFTFGAQNRIGTATVTFEAEAADAPSVTISPVAVDATAAAVADGLIDATYENIALASVAVGLYNDAECNETFTDGWLTATLNGDKDIAYTINANTAFEARTAYIKLTAPASNSTSPDVVKVIAVTQAAREYVFANLAELLENVTPTGTAQQVTVTLTNEVIVGLDGTQGIYLNVTYGPSATTKQIEIYCKNAPTMVAGGTVSGTLENCNWKTFGSTWELCPANWTEITYTAPKAVSSVVVTGAPTKTTYVDGEKFNPAGLTVTVNYTDDTHEVIDASMATWAYNPSQVLAKDQTSVGVQATYNEVQSVEYTVNGLTVGEIPTKTVAEFIAAEGMRCYLVGTVSDIETGTKLKYGNFNLTDASGTIYVYGCLNTEGNAEQFESLNVEDGDKIKVIAETYKYYGSKDEAVNVQFVQEIAVAKISIDNMTMEYEEVATIDATITPAAAANAVTYAIKAGSNDCITLEGDQVTAKLVAGTATIVATIPDAPEYDGAVKEFTVTVTAPDNRYKAEQAGFISVSGRLATITEGTHKDKEYISYEGKKGNAGTATSIQNSDKIRLYQNGGLLVIGATKGCKIDQVSLTTGGTYSSTTVGYSKTETSIATTGDNVANNSLWSTPTGLNTDSVVLVCLGTTNSARLDIASLTVYYTGEPAAVDHLILSGTAKTDFVQGEEFSSDGLVVTASYDAGETDTEDVTDLAIVTPPDMNTAGNGKNVTVSFGGKEASYTINIAVDPNLDNLLGTWKLVTNASALKAGDEIIVAQVVDADGTIYSMGKQNNNNRAQVESTVAGDVLNPALGTKVFTLVDAGAGKFAIQATNGKYLSAAGTGTNNYLKEAADFESDKEKWTITITDNAAKIQAASDNRNTIRYNSGNSIFSCYAESGQNPVALYIRTVSYTRTDMLGNGVYGTICVDHNVPAGGIRGVTVYEIAGREPQYGKIAFDEVTEMEAGVPYVFIAHGNEMALYYGETKVDGPVDKDNGMYGTFTPQTLTALDDIYYFAKSALWGCADLTSLSLPANRAYVKLSEIGYLSSPNPAPGRRRIVMGVQGEQVATGMENVQGDEVQCTKVMLNGQLFILRGEKMYDATGRLVK